MHNLLTSTGRMFLFFESLWIAAWFGIVVWVNVTPPALPYEQILFDTVTRCICAVLGIVLVVMHAKKEKVVEWYKPLIFWVGTFIAARGIVQTWRVVPLVGSMYWKALTAFTVSGMILSTLELMWVISTVSYLNRNDWMNFMAGLGLDPWNWIPTISWDGRYVIPVTVVSPGGGTSKNKLKPSYDSY